MEANSNKLKTWNIRSTKRFETKKRKVEALINLFEENKSSTVKKKAGESLVESYKALKDELKKYVKKPEVDPCLYLTHHGQKAQLDLRKTEVKTIGDPLFIEDVYQLLLRSIIGNLSPYPLNWAKLEQPQNITKTVLLVIKGFRKSDIISNISKLNAISELFPHVVEIMSSNIPFATELSTLHLVTDFHVRKKTYSTVFPKDKDIKLVPPASATMTSRLHLLLSPIQMAMENYPFPQSILEYSKSKDYVFTKDIYSPVTEESPIFSIDCEMCLTDAGTNDLTSIAVINEDCEVIYQTLVKPERRIVNYFTKFSGITRDMLVGVQTRLVDVQDHLRLLLPPNAILCGQSLNCDLHALHMIHPYVIDTSVIFNTSGIRGRKVSLKKLSVMHLHEDIQNNKNGHDPVEDSLAAMKLVKLKLDNIIQYGDKCLEDIIEMKTKFKKDIKVPFLKQPDDKMPLLKESETASKDINMKETSNSSSNDSSVTQKPVKNDGFFSKISKFSKKTCLIGSKDSLDHYDPVMLTDSVQKIIKSSRRKIVSSTLKHMESHDFIICHLDFNSPVCDESCEELNSTLQQVYDGCGNRTMLNVLVTGVDETTYADIKCGLFMVVLKKL